LKNILFVCIENSCRSQMAEAFANMDGHEIIKAYSAGSRPSGSVNPKAVAAMRDTGYDLSVHTSKGLDDIPDIEYDLVVTMGCGDACPYVRAGQRQDWDIPDPKTMNEKDFAEVRDMIRSKVRKLIESV
jgi:arsenate reductase (thioredoxin)